MKGLQMVARRALLATLKGSALTTLVARDQIHSQSPTAALDWPFTKLGRPQTLPLKATCLDGAVVTFPLSAFTKPLRAGEVVTETAEDHASRIGAAIETALDDRGITVEHNGKPVRITFRLTDMLLQQDGAEADAYQYFCNVRCRVVAE